MAFCRGGQPNSDVYVYATVDGGVSAAPFRTKRYSAMIAHLQGHAEACLKVPGRALDALQAEADRDGDLVRTDRERSRAAARPRRRRR